MFKEPRIETIGAPLPTPHSPSTPTTTPTSAVDTPPRGQGIEILDVLFCSCPQSQMQMIVRLFMSCPKIGGKH